MTKDYPKVKEGHPMYAFVREALESGAWVCDALDHNSHDGCSNPNCFKYKFLDDRQPK